MANELDTNKIFAEVMTESVKSLFSNFTNKIRKYFKDEKNKADIDFGDAFISYLRSTKERYGKIKTLLYRHEPKPIHSFYECIGVQCGQKIIDTCCVNNVIDIGHKLIITGTGGIGKTIMLKHFFLDCINQKELVPVLIELRGLNDLEVKDVSMYSYIVNNLNMFGLSLENEYFEYSLIEGCYLILFDGYDEIKSSIKDTVSKQIIELSNKYNSNYYIMSSRPSPGFVGWHDFTELSAVPLSKKQALSLVTKIEYDDVIKDKFYKQLDDSLFEKYKSFASNPLLLTIMLLTFENQASIPDKLNDFYEQAFTALFHAHDALKGAYKREILCKLGCEDFKKVFSYFCFKTFFESKYEFTEAQMTKYLERAKIKVDIRFNSECFINDLTNSVCMLVQDGLNYRFSHRSFQEYFAALYFKQLDDTIQIKFLKKWLNEGHCFDSSNFINMLFDLQDVRFFKNIIYPGLSELKDEYVNNGNSFEYMVDLIFDSVSIRNEDNKDKVLSYKIKNDYMLFTIEQTLKAKKYDYKNQNRYKEFQKITINKINEKFNEKHSCFDISFDEIKEQGIYTDLINSLSWFKDQLNLVLKIYDEYELDQTKYKRTFQSIFDEL